MSLCLAGSTLQGTACTIMAVCDIPLCACVPTIWTSKITRKCQRKILLQHNGDFDGKNLSQKRRVLRAYVYSVCSATMDKSWRAGVGDVKAHGYRLTSRLYFSFWSSSASSITLFMLSLFLVTSCRALLSAVQIHSSVQSWLESQVYKLQ